MFEYVDTYSSGLVRKLVQSSRLLTWKQLWKVEEDGESHKVDYLATLAKHTQAVNVVRWAPKGDLPLARAIPRPPR